MVVSMGICWWYCVTKSNSITLAWEEMGGSWNCESGAVVGKVVMEIRVVGCEVWIGVGVESRERVGGAFQVSI